ncbi:MAG TPA: NADH-quinone oxidoreductase subunit C [Actinopolymorphaceae bacterium]|nr:NADH-quinone oxidoreductase subunit C [Actinopolymorphaceae bacterium]
MSEAGHVRDQLANILGADVALEEGFGPPTLDVPPDRWVDALRALRDAAGHSYFDWLSAVDELDAGFTVWCHLAKLPDRPDTAEVAATANLSEVSRPRSRRTSDKPPTNPPTNPPTHPSATPSTNSPTGERRVEHLLVRTRVPRDDPRLASATGVYEGASWHERETHEMFGIGFDGHPGLAPLLLPEEFEGRPLRKDFVLASRVAKAWPGAKEPGESDQDARRSPSRRRMAPPGVPAPDAWGPRPPGAEDDDDG